MPLNLSNRDQNSGHLFYNRRLRAAITRFSVRMKHDDRKQQAALALSVVFVVLGCGWMALLQAIKPAGLVGQAAIVGDRDSGALYARIDGRFHPALNLTSARLVTGAPSAPAWVKAAEIAKYPTGPMIGIPGIPDDIAVAGNPVSAWSLCDTAAVQGSGDKPVTTAIAGELSGLSRGGRSDPLPPGRALLASHKGFTYLIVNGRRSRIDLADRPVTFNLGLNPSMTRPVALSDALYDAMPATEPLVVPKIPEAGAPSRWLKGAMVGQVLQSRDASGTVSGFYVLLPRGAQKITAFVADLLRTADRRSSVKVIPPDRLVDIPEVAELDLGYYPEGKLSFVDTDANPVTCVSWRKQSTDRQAEVTLFSGRGLPTPPSTDSYLVGLVPDSGATGPVEADQTLILPGAANFAASTSGAVDASTRESLYWVSPQGVRFGIAWDRDTLAALGLDPRRAVQAPWPILRAFAAGPAISRPGALLARDSIRVGTPAVPVNGRPQEGG